ncbi:hypothetical protein T492DRAFT_971528 [Pavlovales sp. CCMP2436]|nr:hypothetical protein T492DRAFT_971528 [Pavlovales sp. CCMP2436]|mmetsp:Transcript_37811/g.93864  ORF Transcript_37811/g.93864 Transcript_37811/m.93864 type:complete len:154 (-) Transcript_37811:323-784(-)
MCLRYRLPSVALPPRVPRGRRAASRELDECERAKDLELVEPQGRARRGHDERAVRSTSPSEDYEDGEERAASCLASAQGSSNKRAVRSNGAKGSGRSNAVINMSAHFNDTLRASIKDAGAIAGMNCASSTSPASPLPSRARGLDKKSSHARNV